MAPMKNFKCTSVMTGFGWTLIGTNDTHCHQYLYILLLVTLIITIALALNGLNLQSAPALIVLDLLLDTVIDPLTILEQETTVNNKSTAERFDPKAFVNCSATGPKNLQEFIS